MYHLGVLCAIGVFLQETTELLNFIISLDVCKKEALK